MSALAPGWLLTARTMAKPSGLHLSTSTVDIHWQLGHAQFDAPNGIGNQGSSGQGMDYSGSFGVAISSNIGVRASWSNYSQVTDERVQSGLRNLN